MIDRRASRLPWDQRHLVHKLIRLHCHVVVHSFSSQTPSTHLMQLAWELLLALSLRHLRFRAGPVISLCHVDCC